MTATQDHGRADLRGPSHDGGRTSDVTLHREASGPHGDAAGERITAVFFDGSPPSYGGGSEMVYRLLTRIDEATFEPVLLAHAEDELYRRLEGEVETAVVPFRGSLDRYDGAILEQPAYRAIGTAGRICQFNAEARSVLARADVCWCMNLRSVLTLAPFAVASPTPIVWNVGLGQPSEGAYRYLNELGLRLADRVFVESEHQARRLFTDRQYAGHADAFAVFSKGIEVDDFAPEREAPPLSEPPYAIGTVASLTPRKGVGQFLEAAIALLHERDDLAVHVAGAPPHESDREYARRLRERVEAAGVADAVTFHGWVEDVSAFYDELDAFVLASRNEGVPGAVREALAATLPVVATDVGGTREVVRDGETGLLVEPDDPEAIARALDSLLDDPEGARAMGAAGRELVAAEHSVSSYVSNYEAFLREVVRA